MQPCSQLSHNQCVSIIHPCIHRYTAPSFFYLLLRYKCIHGIGLCSAQSQHVKYIFYFTLVTTTSTVYSLLNVALIINAATTVNCNIHFNQTEAILLLYYTAQCASGILLLVANSYQVLENVTSYVCALIAKHCYFGKRQR